MIPETHSLVLTTDYRVPDPSRVWPLLQRRRDGLAALGAHHVFVYTSTTDPERVLVSIALETREPVPELLRSRAFFEWFDAVGVEDLPAVFAGELIERFDFVGDLTAAPPPGIVVVGIMVVEDAATFRVHVRETRELFLKAGIRRAALRSVRRSTRGHVPARVVRRGKRGALAAQAGYRRQMVFRCWRRRLSAAVRRTVRAHNAQR
jgi:hypothetical protein